MVVVLRLGSELSLATATVFGVMLFKSIANGGEMSTHIILNLRNHHILITKITIRNAWELLVQVRDDFDDGGFLRPGVD